MANIVITEATVGVKLRFVFNDESVKADGMTKKGVKITHVVDVQQYAQYILLIESDGHGHRFCGSDCDDAPDLLRVDSVRTVATDTLDKLFTELDKLLDI